MEAVRRRALLQRGFMGGALLLLGSSAGLALSPSRIVATPTQPILNMSAKSFQVVVAIAARVVTTRDRDPVAIAHGFDRALSSALEETRRDLDRLLGLFENALPGLLLDGRVQPFTRLDPAGQDHVLAAWRDSRLALRRTGYQALRKLCLAAYYADPTSWPRLGYDPPEGLSAIAYDDSKLGALATNERQPKGSPP